jgi:hypothetical protein
VGGGEPRLPAPGGPSPSGEALAGRWLLALEALAGRAAHAVNNALNGASVNLEVVRIRARPGADAGAGAPFAEAAAGELERANALVAALLALARAPRGEPDVGEALRQVAALAGPALEERRVALAVDAPRERGATSAPPHAVRLALARVLVNVGERLADPTVGGGVAVEVGGAVPADESLRLLRCTLRFSPVPVVRLDLPAGLEPDDLPLDPADLEALRRVDVGIRRDGDALLLYFPAP